ncbi:Uncharacterized sugar isomerase yihS [Nostocoides japonicum T1-X7]|uniref:Uncharacterized sugar isomerase yihS n=1 Tax=Nostocoides japonicum T1-X7 TaxID=1194083 RepID=A0A077LX07_9MICO|nr:AGE family epimerase/isomerase [Tetrasphaera japonica]CCH78206.1 Uncharacterized sugar isomerase yihS [Tetrasphaera japonica T1-X7]
MRAWTDLPSHRRWLEGHSRDLLAFGRRSGAPDGGASWLTDDGYPWPERGVHTWITARTVHVYGLGAMLGIPGCRGVAEQALAGLLPGGPLHDAEFGGWFAEVSASGEAGGTGADKAAYAHAFVVLAAATGACAGLDGARALLDEAGSVLLERFWDEEVGLLVDTWNRDFSVRDPYRGLNATMHGVEAMLSAADVTGDPDWLRRAVRICSAVVGFAEANRWRFPEHYDATWSPRLDLNADRPDDPFKPFGATVGHGLEWSRLLLHLEASCAARGVPVEVDVVGAARHLYARAVEDGWSVDGAPGFVYTTDWDGTPVVRTRMHWVVAEAIGAAAALHERTGETAYATDYARWWDYAATYLVDHEQGSWHHELAPDNSPSARVWPGKPDLYHAVQATLIPRLPLTPAMATAVSEGLLREV